MTILVVSGWYADQRDVLVQWTGTVFKGQGGEYLPDDLSWPLHPVVFGGYVDKPLPAQQHHGERDNSDDNSNNGEGVSVHADILPSDDPLYRFLFTYTAKHGYPPSMRECAAATGNPSLSTVRERLQRMEQRGWISLAGTRVARGMRLMVNLDKEGSDV